jgi:transcriptional regulator with XRE-family HTH domain
MEPIVDYLQRKLKTAGPRRFAAIAQATGVSPSLLPKLAYGMRDNPRIQTIQPLLDFFHAVDRGAATLPEPQEEEARAAE